MSLEAVIQENTNALNQLIALLSNPVALTAASAPVIAESKGKAPADKPEKKPSADAAKTAATKTDSTTVAAESSGETQTETAAAVDYDTVKAAVIKLSQAKGREVVIDVLSRFGVSKAPDLKPEQYAKALEHINSVIAGGAA